MSEEVLVDDFVKITIDKANNGCARMQFLLKRIEKDIAELSDWGITIDVDVKGNEKFGEKLFM